MSKILLLNAPETFLGDNHASPPLGLLYVAAMFPSTEYQVDVLDGVILGWDKLLAEVAAYQPQIVGITCLTPNRMKALKLARLVKDFDPNIKIVFGGVHPTIMGRQLLENYPEIDYVVAGEGEVTFKELCDAVLGKSPADLKNVKGLLYRAPSGQIVANQVRDYIQNLDQLPFPRWDLINGDDYLAIQGDMRSTVVNGTDVSRAKRYNLIFSRGCVGSCTFCSTWWIWRGYRHRSPENMLAEIKLVKEKYGAQNIIFLDDCFTVDRGAIIKLCDLLIASEVKIAFKCSTRTDLLDEELIKKMRAAGCYEISFGVETGDANILNSMNKKNSLAKTAEVFELVKKNSIIATAMMVSGNIGENYQTINNTVNFLKNIKPDIVATGHGLWVLPGTKVYYYCRQKGYLTDDFWLADKPFELFHWEFGKFDLNCFEIAVKRGVYLTPFRYLNYIYIFSWEFMINKFKGLKYRLKKIKKSRLILKLLKPLFFLKKNLVILIKKMAAPQIIAAYLKNNETVKLHLGCAERNFPGWLNCDINIYADCYLDVGKPLLIPDDSADFIYSEHLIEHLEYPAANDFLRECRRVLKAGGVIRTATPDLDFFIKGALAEHQELFSDFIANKQNSFLKLRDLPGNMNSMIMHITRFCDHPYVYQKTTLKQLLAKCGFRDIEEKKLGDSDYNDLKNLETNSMGRERDDHQAHLEHTMAFEAKK